MSKDTYPSVIGAYARFATSMWSVMRTVSYVNVPAVQLSFYITAESPYRSKVNRTRRYPHCTIVFIVSVLIAVDHVTIETILFLHYNRVLRYQGLL